MLFKFSCPNCTRHLEADASYSGTMAECPGCSAAVHIPEPRIGPGTTLGGHRLERLLGRGGMGSVYLARQLAMDRQVAVKILPASLTEDEAFVQRFLHEIHTAAKLEHPNIVTAFDAGEDAGVYYLAMAYVDGETLQEKLKREGPLSEERVLDVGLKVSRALGYAWKNFAVLHRDIKPANIMWDRFGEVKLMDLGVAKIVGEETGLTLTGVALGTPNYMSPEQVKGCSDIDCRADIYSLGCTLFHLLTGHQPYVGKNPLHVMNLHVTAPLPPIRSENPAVSRACEALIHAMMRKNRDDRPQDWAAVVEVIEAVRSGSGKQHPPRSRRLPPFRRWPRWAIWASASMLALVMFLAMLGGAAKRRRAAAATAAASSEAGAKAPVVAEFREAGKTLDPKAAGMAGLRPQAPPATPVKAAAGSADSETKEAVSEDAEPYTFAATMRVLAKALADRDLEKATSYWEKAKDHLPRDKSTAHNVEQTERILAGLNDLPALVMGSFKKDVGREITVRLSGGGWTTLRIENVQRRRVIATHATPDGLREEIRLTMEDLDREEQWKRIGPPQDPVTETIRGLLSLRLGRRAMAVTGLKRGHTALGRAVLKELEHRGMLAKRLDGKGRLSRWSRKFQSR